MLTATLFCSQKEKTSPLEIISSYSKSAPSTGFSGPYHFVDSVDWGKHFEFDIVVRKIQDEKTQEVFRKNFGSGSMDKTY